MSGDISTYTEIKDISARLASIAMILEQEKCASEEMELGQGFDENMNVDMCADLFKALSNNERLKILQSLGSDASYFAQLAQLTMLDNSPLRFHLTVLKDVNLITQERFRGKYMITDLGRQALAMASYFYTYMQKQEMHEHD